MDSANETFGYSRLWLICWILGRFELNDVDYSHEETGGCAALTQPLFDRPRHRMFSKLMAPLLASLLLFVPLSGCGREPTTKPSAGQPPAPVLRTLTGDDETRAKVLDAQIFSAMMFDRWTEAIARAEELLVLRTHAQSPKQFETVSAEWCLRTLRRVAASPREDRVAFRSAHTMYQQAERLDAQGKYAQGQPLAEKALEIRRRLLTDDNPDTARSYNNLAINLNAQGKYAQAQPLFEKAPESIRRLLGDDHPETAQGYSNVAANLNAQGKYAQAQPLYEKALEIERRLLGDENTETARGYNDVARTSTPRGNTPRPSRSARRCWKSGVACSPTTTATPP